MRLHLPPDQSHEPEHPIVAWIGLAAIVVAIIVIVWARFELRGTSEIESALTPPPHAVNSIAKQKNGKAEQRSEAEAAAAKSRWATGFSH